MSPEHLVLNSLPVESREMETEGRKARLEKDVSWQGSASSELVPLEIHISPTSSSRSPKEQTGVLCQPTLSLLEPLRKCTETGFEMSLERNVWRGFLRAVS